MSCVCVCGSSCETDAEEGNWRQKKIVVTLHVKLHLCSRTRLQEKRAPAEPFWLPSAGRNKVCFPTLASLLQPCLHCLSGPSRPLGFPPFQGSSSGRQFSASGCLMGLNIPMAGTPKRSRKQTQKQIATKVRRANCYLAATMTSLVRLEAPSKHFSLCIHSNSVPDNNVSFASEQTCDATQRPYAIWPGIRAGTPTH